MRRARRRASPALEEIAASLVGARSRPSSILLMHVHPDDSGSAPELARGWRVPVYVHPAEVPLAAAGRSRVPMPPAGLGAFAEEFSGP